MIVWLRGAPNVGKTAVGKVLLSYFRQCECFDRSFLLIDGDRFREALGNDLGHTIGDRNRNASRLIGVVKMLAEQLNVLVCANLTSNEFQQAAHDTLSDYYDIHLYADNSSLLRRDSTKGVYATVEKPQQELVASDTLVKPFMAINTSDCEGLTPEDIARDIYLKLVCK